NTQILITIMILLTSIVIIFGWLFNIGEILNIFPNTSTIKFNTALLFALSSINILTSSNRSKVSTVVYTFGSIFILIIAFLTIGQYYFKSNYDVNNFFIQDINTSGFPGRMSETTAICFLLTGFSLLGMRSENALFRRSVQYLLLIIAMLSFVSLTTDVLQTPIENKTFFLCSMRSEERRVGEEYVFV